MARVLIAEDDDSIRLVLRHVLAHAGHEVTAVSDGDAAVAALHAAPHELAIVDVHMPGPRCAELLEALRALRPSLGLIVASGGSVDDVELPPGAVSLPKPYDPPRLLDIVDRLLHEAGDAR